LTFFFREQVERKRSNSGAIAKEKTEQAMMDNSFEVMRAKYIPKDNSFLLFAAGVPLPSMNENSAIAKLYFNPKNQ